MAVSRATFIGFSVFRKSFLSSFPPAFSLSPVASTLQPFRNFRLSACLSTQESSTHSSLQSESLTTNINLWKPMCLYYTHGMCTKMDDPSHLETFNHDCCEELKVSASKTRQISSQPLDFLLVLDLEGKVEILEFPVVMMDAKTMNVVDIFHRFVRPTEMSEQRIHEYIEGKYGKLGVDRVWHETAIPFKEVIEQFEAWVEKHHLWRKEQGGILNQAAFVTCGNWDLKTKVPQQCKVSQMKLPPYFVEWINLKDIYLNFYKRRATGMVTMMKELQIPLLGSHHLGIDDSRNITRVLQRMITDGAILQITARRRNCDSLDNENVEFLFKNRIR